MKIASDGLWYTWEQGKFYGANKPHARVVVSKTALTTSNDLFRTLLFSNVYGDQFYEVPQANLKTLSRNHRVGTDAATMTLVLRNAGPIVVEEDLDQAYDGSSTSPTKRELQEQGEPGKYTYRRGVSSDGSRANPWGYAPTEFVDLFLPNRVIRTFEGYGTDGAEYPWDDDNLVLSGTWLIDRVQMNATGDMTVECRDLAKLLIEQRLYPPIVPLDSYPINFCSDSTTTDVIPGTTTTTTTSTPETIGPNVARHSTEAWDSSAAPWYGYNASVFGHRASHAFDEQYTTFWISMRNSKPSEDWSYEWLDLICGGEPINLVQLRPWVGGYTLYVGIMEDGVWQGSATVPYNRNANPAYPNGSDIKYVKKINMPAGEEWFGIDLDRIYNADKVRLVFTDLQWFGRIANGDYRAGVYDANAFGYTPAGVETTVTENPEEEVIVDVPGNIDDYTEIIKLFLAWSGFYWPQDGSFEDDPLFLKDEWGAKGGRVWGDFFYSGAYPVEPPCIDPAYWDNKSVMDAINQVKEILGFIGYVDNTGGFIWRPPNIWANGNYVTGLGYRGESSIPIVEERNLLLDYGVTVDDASLRSEIVVVSSDDPTVHGSYSPGYASGEESPTSLESFGTIADDQIVTDLSLLAGQQRVMLVPDYPFGQGLDDEQAARAELEKFAYLVSLWIHWSYRKGRVKIPANPALDVDDQIRIYEAKTSETYIHYILSQNVSLDFETGVYTADLETHWLGNGPEASWHMFVNDLPPALLAYLCQQEIMTGAICGDENTEGSSTPWSPGSLPDVPDTPIQVPRTPPELELPLPSQPSVIPIPPGDPDPEEGGETIQDPPSGSNPGSVTNCSPEFFNAYWPATGPDVAYSSNAGKFWFRGANGTQSDCILDVRTFAAFRLLSDIFIEKGVEVHYASGKVFKYIAGTNIRSNHCWGVACDVNSRPLVWGKSIHDHPAAIRNAYLQIASRANAIKTMNGKTVFKWGQYFSNKPDPMHWQVCVKASDIAGGVIDTYKTPPP